ncbi:MAG: hypothetical protein RIB59_13485 [Rhodospirillales bacterium]
MQALHLTASAHCPADGREAVLVDPAYPGEAVSDTRYPLPTLTHEETKTLLHDYNAVVTRLCRLNKNEEGWWLTWLSCRDQHNNDLLGNLHLLFRLRKCLQDPAAPLALTFCCPSPATASAARMIAEEAGRRIYSRAADRFTWLCRSGVYLLSPVIGMLRVFRHGIKLVLAACRYPIPERYVTNRSVILVTHFPDSFQHQKPPYRDAYFGNLAHWLENRGERVLILGQPQGEVFPTTDRCRSFDGFALATTGHALSLHDAFRLALSAFLSGFRLRLSGEGFPNFNGLIRESLKHSVIHKGMGLIVKRSLQNLLDRNPNARVIHIYENNPWERGVALAAKNRPDPRDVIGFLHCAVLPAHLKNVVTPEEIPIRPAPDRIVCTGPAARDIFLSLGAHDPDRVFSGCNLRGPEFSRLVPRHDPPQTIHTVLVVLEGLEKMVGLLRFAECAARLSPGYRFIVRAHPAYPYERLARLAGIETGPAGPLRKSDIGDLQEDLERADAVLYQGSTVALIAGFMGIPLMRFEGDSLLTDDPLFDCDLLKRRVRQPQDVASAIRSFLSLPMNDYRIEMQQRQGYILRYLAPPSDQAHEPFLPQEKLQYPSRPIS